jgi:hypothetical protein
MSSQPVTAITIRFPAPRDRTTGEPASIAQADWIAGITHAALGGVSAWCAGANAHLEPMVTVEQDEPGDAP